MDGREWKQYEHWKQEAQFLRGENQHLRRQVDTYRPVWYRASVRINELQQRVEKLAAENRLLKQKVKDLTLSAAQGSEGTAQATPPVVKPSVLKKRPRRPGRKAGHAAALRPRPDKIDSHQQVDLPRDSAGLESCPSCNSCLMELEDHERIVEDIIPARVVVKCYHTRGRFCPCWQKAGGVAGTREQPPAANIPHGQLGINALSTAMLLRIVHRLPFRQITAVFANLPELRVSPGAIARQVQRVADWLDGDYEKLMLQLRCAPIVHADETGWRTNGRNGYLWTITSPKTDSNSAHTLYHLNKSRGGKVILRLLGKAFGGTLVSDFYSAYSKMPCRKQKCLAHLLRELNQTAEKITGVRIGQFSGRIQTIAQADAAAQKPLGALDWIKSAVSRTCVRRLREDQLKSLAHREYDEPNARRIAKRMAKHLDELTAFLREKDLDATNHAAERAIRPAVVMRKITGGSRSKSGADAWATLASLLRTVDQEGKKFITDDQVDADRRLGVGKTTNLHRGAMRSVAR